MFSIHYTGSYDLNTQCKELYSQYTMQGVMISIHNKGVMISIHNKGVMISIHNKGVMFSIHNTWSYVLNTQTRKL